MAKELRVKAVVANHKLCTEEDDDVHATDHENDQRVRLVFRSQAEFASGNFSVVYLGSLEVPERRAVAIKRCRLQQNVRNREIVILRALQHTNIIKLLYFFWTRQAKYREMNMVFEFIPETLYKVMKTTEGHLAIADVENYMYQLLSAVAHIHSLRVCHRDIKPQNILVDRAKRLLKLGDFGSAKMLKENDKHGSVPYIVSRHYRAPELILGNKRYSLKIDVWSCGCILAELLQKSVVFPGANQPEQMRMIVNMLGNPTYREMEELRPGYLAKSGHPLNRPANTRVGPYLPRSWKDKIGPERGEVSRVVYDLLGALLQYSASRRLTAEQALHHALFMQSTQRAPATTKISPLSMKQLTV